VNTGVIQ